MCASAFSFSVKNPVHSSTTSTPSSSHGRSSGFLSAKILMSLPFTLKPSSVSSNSPSNLPCAVSYLKA